MHDETAQERFARCWSEAMLGYAHAASAATWIMTNRTLAFWGEATRSMAEAARAREPETTSDSWFRPGPVRNALLPRETAPSWSFPRFDQSAFGYEPFGRTSPFAVSPFGAPPLPSPFAMWLGMLQLKGPPASWPMAFGMIASGVPHVIAWPAAQANTAMLDAAEAAKTAFGTMLAGYASQGSAGRRYEPEPRRRRSS